jgi:hypothetical protein
VDDSGRILDVCEIGDDSYGYAYLSALLAERATGPYSVAIAADRNDRLVPMLLSTAGWALTVVDDEATDDFSDRFTDELPDDVDAAPSQRRALGLARALQAGALSATLLAPPPELVGLKPVLAAHSALAVGRHAAAVALREVLRELYPAALRAYPDPADPVALAVMDALPEPGTLASSTSGRGRDAAAAADAVSAQLAAAGIADQAAVTEAITALRVAIAETPRRGQISKSLTATVAETVRQAVAAVRACDAASTVLVNALAARAGAPRPEASPPDRYPSPPQPAPPVRTGPGAPLRPTPPAGPLPPAGAPAAPAAPVTAPRTAPPPAPAPPPLAKPPPAPAPPPLAAPPPAPALPPLAAPPPAPALPPLAAPPPAPAPPPLAARAPTGPAPAGGSAPAPPPPARSQPPTPRPARTPPPPTIRPSAPAHAAAGSPAGSVPSAPPARHRGGPAHNRPVSPPPPPPPGITPIIEPRSPAPPHWQEDPSDRGSPVIQVPAPRPAPERSARGSRTDWPTSPPADDGWAVSPATTGPVVPPDPGSASRLGPPAVPPRPTDYAGATGYSRDADYSAPASGPGPTGPGDSRSARSSWAESRWGGSGPPNGAAVPPARPSGGVTPPWRDDDLQPPDPPALRLVEPTLPEELRDGYGYSPPRPDPPPLRLVEPTGNGIPRSVPPVSADDDDSLLIFAQTRSAWFDQEPSAPWESEMDAGWRAAEQAAQPTVGDRTGAGLPRRVPHANLVPGAPPRRDDRPLRVVRDPASIAAHTSGYFSGWRRGQEVGGYPLGGRPGRQAAGAWEFHRDDDRLSG